jgi:CHAT domain-containing protein
LLPLSLTPLQFTKATSLQPVNPNDIDSLALTRSVQEVGISFQRLPFTRQEGDRILSLVPNTQSQSAFDFAANRTTATNPQLGQYQIVHFATHGLLNSQNPELSGVVFSLVMELSILLGCFHAARGVEINRKSLAAHTPTGVNLQHVGKLIMM